MLRHREIMMLGALWVVLLVCNASATCLVGDINGDCTVDFEDVALLVQQWLSTSPEDSADLNGDDKIDISDFVLLAGNWHRFHIPLIVINEIHYHPDNNTEHVEFVELYNAGDQTININGWFFEGAIRYTFQHEVLMNPGDFILVAENPTAMKAKFGVFAYGPFEGKLSNEGERLVLRDATGNKIDEVDYDSDFPWPIAANGEGASMELLNPCLDNDLGGSWRSSGYHADRPELAFGTPTPGFQNSVNAINIPPQIRQVNHNPEQPLSSQSGTITAKVTDPDGVKQVKLKYQIVAPGSYIPAYLPVSPISALIANPYQDRPINPAFENPANWNEVTMLDDGQGQDAIAGDDIYTAVIAGQINRTLVRYRIIAEDNSDNLIQVPYADDASLNFAYYVFNGVPDYVAAEDSVIAPGHVYSADILTSIPVYTLITRAADLYQCNGYNSADRIPQGTANLNNQYAGRVYNWEGALVYEGKVYDHIGYRLRGGNGRYNYAEQSGNFAGKRSMKFRFNRGNFFQARDIYGDKFPSKWQHLNTGKMFGNQIVWSSYNSYPYGLNEVMDMLLFEAADVPAYKTWWIHLRVVDGAEEAPTGPDGQYNGDFWGLHIAFEDYDGAFLERLGLPKGNLYKLSDKIYDGLDQLRYQGENAVDDASDYENIRWNLTYEASADFIRNHLDCNEWYRYHTVIEAIRSFDIFTGATCTHCLKNVAWYFYPDYTPENSYFGKVQFFPFDVDDSWGSYFNYGIDHGKGAIYDQSYIDHVFTQYPIDPEKSPLKQDYRNYIREFRDLHWQTEVINGMIAELAAFIEDFVPADRDRWRLDPTPGTPMDNGSLEYCAALMYQFAWTPGYYEGGFYWDGTSNHLDDRANNLDIPYSYDKDDQHCVEDDLTRIPNTPTISYIGEANYPLNDLRFQTSEFSDPQGSLTFAAMKWRIGEHDLNYIPEPTDEVILLEKNSFWRYFKGTIEPTNPVNEWRQAGFNDEDWLLGKTSIGFADNDDSTVLGDMYNVYYTVYLRNTFDITNKDQVQILKLHVYVDDGCIIWINGKEVKRMYCGDGDKLYNSLTDMTDHEAANYEEVTLTGPYDYLINGTNVIAVHALQATKSSSDFSIDVSISMSTQEPVVPILGTSKHEIHAVWESDEITNPGNLDIQIPGSAVRVGRTYRVRSRMKDNTGRWSHWSQPIEFVAGEPIGADILNYLRVSELMYNPAADSGGTYDKNEFEFIELKNISTTKTLDLSTVSISDGVAFTFAGSSVTSLGPGQFVLVVRNKTAFEFRYGTGVSGKIAGAYSGKLDNAGETVEISDTWNGQVVVLTYNNGYGWPQAADGAGHSLVPVDWWAMEDQQEGILDYCGNWRASTYIGGSPGQDDQQPTTTVVINEVMAHTDYSNPQKPEYDSNDWIELYNTSGSVVSLSSYYLSDDIDDLKKWALPATSVGANGRVSFDEVSGFHNPITTGFGLDKAGEQVILSYLPGNSQDRIVDCISFKGQEIGVSLGRYGDGGTYWFTMLPSRNAKNTAGIVGVVINEIMYHPVDPNEEYIELYNPTGTAVVLDSADGQWRLDGAVDYTFPAGLSIPVGGRLVVVGFDPFVEAARLDAFAAGYGAGTLTPGVNVVGSWNGDLSNRGERIAIEKPQAPDVVGDDVSWIIVDEVIYGDVSPWPQTPDGGGDALQRIHADQTHSGNDPADWKSAAPSPGKANL